MRIRMQTAVLITALACSLGLVVPGSAQAQTTVSAGIVSSAPSASTCGAPKNPWGYNYCGGKYIYRPASSICSYFRCMDNFWNGRGYVMQCRDGVLGKSGGISGSCSWHGGNRRPLLNR
jgi:hypothetical protein